MQAALRAARHETAEHEEERAEAAHAAAITVESEMQLRGEVRMALD